MALLTLRDAALAFGHTPLLDGVSFAIDAGERVCLVGRNGTGKSTLLDVVVGVRTPDDGYREVNPTVTLGYVPQNVPDDLRGSVRDVVTDGLGAVARDLKAYADLSASRAPDPERLHTLESRIDASGGWALASRVDAVLDRLALAGDDRFERLSGGQRRRVLIARALAAEPQILVLDEPTNHLDLDNILWLQGWLQRFGGACLFTTHDRRLIEQIATRIVELDRGELTSWPGDYGNYLRRRAERDAAEALANARADRLLANEETWIRQGIQARRTRNEGRVRRLEAMRADRRSRRTGPGAAALGRLDAAQTGRRLVEATDISVSIGGRSLLKPFSLQVMRGDRIGVIGANGSGKTTLLRVLLGELEPASGSIERTDGLAVAYLDQLRTLPDESGKVRDQVAGGADFVGEGERRRHVVSYLQEFLFSPERANQPVSILSGGERARLVLARLFITPAQLLVLDEPTNDLDIETLEVLEARLAEFDGTLLLVSHDRTFLDNVVTSIVAIDDDGCVAEYVGGYADFERQRPVAADARPGGARRLRRAPGEQGVAVAPAPSAETPTRAAKSTGAGSGRPDARLGFNERRELERLPGEIETLERAVAEFGAALARPDLYRDEPERVAGLKTSLERAQASLDAAFERWAELEERA